MFHRLLKIFEKSFPYLDQSLDNLIPQVIPFILSDMASISQDEFKNFVAFLLDYSPEYSILFDSIKKKLSPIFELVK
jgi:hypothetical protein